MAFDLKSALTTIAPTLATMLEGPFAGTAIAALEQALGLANGAGKEGIAQVLQSGAMSPETLAAVRAADQKHAEIMSQQNIDLARINADVIRADNDNINNARDNNTKSNMQDSLFKLSLLILSITIGTEIYVLVNGIPKTVPDIVTGRVLGLLDAAATMVLGYWYGSSHGSAIKTDVIAEKKT